MQKMKIIDGYIWLVITDKAKEVYSSGCFEIYTLHEDGSESLCQNHIDINKALEERLDLAIEVGEL